MIQMTVPKCWIETTPEDSEYIRYIAPHITPDCWFENQGRKFVINFHGTQTVVEWGELKKLSNLAFEVLNNQESIQNESNLLIAIMIAEYVIAGLIEKANENEQQ